MLWGTKKHDKVLHLKVAKNEAQKIHKDYDVVIKHTRTLDQGEIAKLPVEERRRLFQVYTVALKEKTRRIGLKEATRSRFMQKEAPL